MQNPTVSPTQAQTKPEMPPSEIVTPAHEAPVEHQEGWPQRPAMFGELLTPVQAAQYLRLDEIGHTPRSAIRVLNYWRGKSQLRATKFARHVWFLRSELDHFLQAKTEP